MQNSLSIVNERIIYFEIKATSVGSNSDDSSIKLPIYEKWNNYVELYRKNTTTPRSA